MIEPIDWKRRATYMSERHGVLSADEAVWDIDALWFDPDPKSRSGANGWRSNSTERRMYEEGERG